VQKVHDSGFLHRDIKPSNILISKNFEPTLIDFGQAKKIEEVNDFFRASGTKKFKAYEQYNEELRQGIWTDVYGIAATMYNCVTGEDPIDSRIRAEEKIDLKIKDNNCFRQSIFRMIERGLELSPENRYNSVIQMRESLS
jgi:serine/threonine protein kinase